MKRLFWIIPLVLLAGVLSVVFYVKISLPNVGPAPDLTVEQTPERLARGAYLANHVMGCIDCHSMRDMNLYSGPRTGTPYAGGGPEFTIETGAPGNFYAPNLTPYHLKNWTDGEIYRAIVSGVSKDGRALFPAMPSHLYGQLDQEDIYAVIAYLRTLPEYKYDVPAPEAKFPFSLIMNTIPKKPAHRKIPDKANLVAYGEYVITMAACIDCHTPVKGGKPDLNEAYSGGMEFKLPQGIVRSANITPDSTTGIGYWNEEVFVQLFKAYADSSFVPHEVGDGFNTIMPWTVYSHMDDYDLKAIYAYLRSIPPKEKEVVTFSPKE